MGAQIIQSAHLKKDRTSYQLVFINNNVFDPSW